MINTSQVARLPSECNVLNKGKSDLIKINCSSASGGCADPRVWDLISEETPFVKSWLRPCSNATCYNDSIFSLLISFSVLQ